MANTVDPIENFKAQVSAIQNEPQRQKLLTLASTGRHVLLSYPVDMTDDELLDFAAWLLTGFRTELPPTTDGRIALVSQRSGLIGRG